MYSKVVKIIFHQLKVRESFEEKLISYLESSLSFQVKEEKKYSNRSINKEIML